jgi:DNA primase
VERSSIPNPSTTTCCRRRYRCAKCRRRQGRYIGVAPLGTSLTDEQAHQLARLGTQPIVATDADLAGRIAAERDLWMLSCYRLDPLDARLPDGTDPADLLALAGPTAHTGALAGAQPLAEQLIDERLKNLPPLTLCWKQPA